MKDSSLTKQELIEELSLLKKKIKKLQLSESKHKQAEALLRESEERYRILFENAQEAIFVIQDARLVFINPNVTQQFGYSTDDFMSKSFIEFIHPDDQNMVLDNHIRRLKGEELPNTYSFRIIHKDGSVKWGDLSAVLISWQGKPATLNFLKDITGHKQIEEELRENEERYRSLVDNAQEAIFVIQDYKLVFINPNAAPQLGYTSEDFLSKTFLEFIHPDDQKMVFDNYTRRVMGEDFPNIYSFRLIHKDGSIKWAELNSVLINWKGKPAVMIFMTDVTDRKQAEELLRESEERYRKLFENVQEAIFVVQDGKLVFLNPITTRKIGFSAEDLMSKSFLEFIHPDDQNMVLDNYIKRLKGEELPNLYPFRTIRSDGSVMWVELSAVSIDWQGRPATLNFLTEITDRKQSEDMLRESEKRYQLIAANTADMISTMNMEMQFTYVSPACVRLLGYTVEETLSLPLDKVLTPESFQLGMAVFEEEMRLETSGKADPNRTRNVQIEQIKKDGSIIPMESALTFIRDENGKPVEILMVTRDITERKKSEELLRESEERYRGLIDNAQEAIFVVQEYKLVFINPIATLMVGYSTEEFMSKSFIEFVHPDDQNMVFENHIRRMQGDQFNNTYCLRLVHKNGSVRWGELTAVLMNWNGKPATLNFMTDITDRKQSEEALKDSELMFRTLFEAANDAIFLMDDGTFIDCNPKALEMYGCGREQIIGHSPVNFSPDVQPDGSASREKAMEKINAALQGQPQLFEWKHRRYDGTLFDAEVSLNAFPAKGKYYIRSIVRDITDRKQIEEALRQSEERFRELSIVDDLTRLYNSRHFYAQLKIELERSKRYEQPLTLLMLDLDDFKAFNDTYGHIEGDEVLSRLGQVIKRCLRETDIAFRYGGEEFTILLPMTTGAEGAVIAERIRQEFKKETFSPKLDQAVHLTVSIGIGQYESGEDMRAFVHRVDLLMYHGKKNGKDRICSAS